MSGECRLLPFDCQQYTHIFSATNHYKTIILDLGDVLFHWSAKAVTVLPRQTLKCIMLSPVWSALERGEIEETVAFEAIGLELSINPEFIREALAQAKTTLRVDTKLIAKLRDLKALTDVKVVAMTNIARNDYAYLCKILTDWSLFDQVFTSFEIGIRKPEFEFYKVVLREAGANPSETIFVDDKIENVIAARSLGINGIVFESGPKLLRGLNSLLLDAISRGRHYLKDNAGKRHSMIEDGTPIHDNFSQFLLLEATRDRSLTTLSTNEGECARTWNYFIGKPVGTTSIYPNDVDTTSCSLLALSPNSESANLVLDKMLANRNSAGYVQTYFDPLRPRVDPIVCINILRAFYKYNRGHQLPSTLKYISDTLENRGCSDGTLHYYSAESFLFFVSRLVLENPSAQELQKLLPNLREGLRERVGRQDDPLAVAMRVLACQGSNVWAESDLAYLRTLQDVDGGWDIGWVCRFGRSRARIGHRGLTTAYAVKALGGGSWDEYVGLEKVGREVGVGSSRLLVRLRRLMESVRMGFVSHGEA